MNLYLLSQSLWIEIGTGNITAYISHLNKIVVKDDDTSCSKD